MKPIPFLILLGLLTTSWANDILPGHDPGKPIVLRGGTIHPISSAPLTDSKLLIEAGRITHLAPLTETLLGEEDAIVIDCEGQHVYPGLLSANGVLGLVEINAVRATRDLQEPGLINPSVRAEVAVNPDSELLPVARANGILTSLSVPQGGLISGKSALIHLDGWTWEEMTVRAPVGMHLRWPRMRHSSTATDESRKAQRKRWEESLEKLDQFFDDARAYQRAKAAPRPDFRSDVRFDAMLPVLEKRLPLYVHALGAIEIQKALQFTQAQEVTTVLVSGQDVWRVADLLKERDVPVILTTVQELPLRRWESYDQAHRVPGLLKQAGVRFCIANGEGNTSGASNARNLPYLAASVVNEAFSAEDALRSITLSAAEILGVGDQLGSLEPGKEATLMITDGNPLEITTNVQRAFIRGREIDLSSKHTELYQKYLEKQRRADP